MVGQMRVIASDLAEGETLRDYRRAYDARTKRPRLRLRARVTEGRLARRSFGDYGEATTTSEGTW